MFSLNLIEGWINVQNFMGVDKIEVIFGLIARYFDSAWYPVIIRIAFLFINNYIFIYLYSLLGIVSTCMVFVRIFKEIAFTYFLMFTSFSYLC